MAAVVQQVLQRVVVVFSFLRVREMMKLPEAQKLTMRLSILPRLLMLVHTMSKAVGRGATTETTTMDDHINITASNTAIIRVTATATALMLLLLMATQTRMPWASPFRPAPHHNGRRPITTR